MDTQIRGHALDNSTNVNVAKSDTKVYEGKGKGRGIVVMSMSRTTRVLMAIKQFLMIMDIIQAMLIINRSQVHRIALMNRVRMILEQNPKRRGESATIVT